MKTKCLRLHSYSPTHRCAICILLFLCYHIFAQEQTFHISLAADKNDYILGEPVIVKVVISYDGTSVLDLNNPLDEGDFKERVDIALGASGVFKRVQTWTEAIDSRIDRELAPRIHLIQGGKLLRSLTLFCWGGNEAKTNQLIFSRAGLYRIKYTVSLGAESFAGTTNVTFAEPRSNVDQNAWEWLQIQEANTLQEYGELDHLFAEEGPRTMVLGHLAELLSQYPESVQAKYVQARLANAKEESRLANANANSAASIFDQSVKGLESQWYDVKGFLRDTNSSWRAEFAGKDGALLIEKVEGKMTDAEYDQQDADLLKTYVKKYCQPLSPDEWKRRNDAYAKEDADRRQRQISEMMSHAAENDLLFRAARSNTVPK